ncbi:unnamed protein product [Trichobilharzia regenti]|nr:unnamed protein product [Trichobilharzia regenti]
MPKGNKSEKRFLRVRDETVALSAQLMSYSLPSDYPTFLYMDAADIRHLKGSPVLGMWWAVSTVMSRSNYIPHRNGIDKIMCLIPVWDMMNHKSDYITSRYDLEMDELVFSTMEAYEPGDQIFMDYGKRTNAEFFVFAGFVPQFNPHNAVTITLGKFLLHNLHLFFLLQNVY